MARPTWPAAFAALLVAGASASPLAQEEEPRPSELTEEVEVRLATVPLLVTDKRGRPIDDLALEEVEVREGGHERRVAFLEPFRTRDTVLPAIEPQPPREPAPPEPAPPEPAPPEPAPPEPAPPEPAPSDPAAAPEPARVERRIVFLFDAKNSRLPNRLKWAEGALAWVRAEMSPSDRVAVAVYDGSVRYVVPFTAQRPLLEGALANTHWLEKGNLDRRTQMSGLMDALTTCDLSFDQRNCALQAVQTYVYDWQTESRLTLEALGGFIAGLGALPGRKMVIYGSEGWIADPGNLAMSAILAEFGTEKMSVSDLQSRLRLDLNLEMLKLFGKAATAGTAFFPIDVRSIADRDWVSEASEEFQLHERQLVNPMAEIFDLSRGALSSLAESSGGRAYFGADAPKRISEAIASSRGLYTLGYYSEGPPGHRLRIKVRRKNVQVSDPMGSTAARPPRPLASEVAVFTPKPEPDGYLVPIAVELDLAGLPYEKAPKDTWAVQLSVYASLVDARGSVAGEAFEIVDVTLSGQDYEQRGSRKFRHVVGVRVPAGSYRARVRVTDHGLTLLADRLVPQPIQVPTAGAAAGPHAGGDEPSP